ncbi:MAG: lipocalin family protein [Alistipes senegalensis]|nr:lipocalin family protein [Bacteroides cellulosilyticus]MCM1351157.1 lipocalin family protein [Alistipes senegalensis]
MNSKNLFRAASGMIAIGLLAACGEAEHPRIEGSWVEPVPGMEHTMQGIRLEKEGKASSINMATLQYERWERTGDRLILTGKSIGNHQTLPFTDTLEIRTLTADELVLERNDGCTARYERKK